MDELLYMDEEQLKLQIAENSKLIDQFLKELDETMQINSAKNHHYNGY